MNIPCRVSSDLNAWHNEQLQPEVVEPNYFLDQANERLADDGVHEFVRVCGLPYLCEILNENLSESAHAELLGLLVGPMEEKLAADAEWQANREARNSAKADKENRLLLEIESLNNELASMKKMVAI